MADVLVARSALGRAMDEPPQVHGVPSEVYLAERRAEAMVTVRFDEADAELPAALAARTGLRLSGRGRAVTGDRGTALWLGPGEWLVTCARESSAEVIEAVSSTAGGVAIDTSDAWFVARISGAHGRAVLAQGCAINLDSGQFAPGACAVTLLARIRALIHHIDAPPAYDVYVERSYAPYIWAWLCDAMTEFFPVKERR